MKSMSVLEETGVKKGEDTQANRQSPQQLFRGALKGLGWSPLASTVPTFVQEGIGGGLLRAVVDPLQRAALCQGLADTVGEATSCSSLSPAAQRRANKDFPTEEVWAEGCPVCMRPFSFHFAVVTAPGHPTHPHVFLISSCQDKLLTKKAQP